MTYLTHMQVLPLERKSNERCIKFVWLKMAKNLAQRSRKWHKKNQIGETGGERKKNPSADPVYFTKSSKLKYIAYLMAHPRDFGHQVFASVWN